MEKSLSSHLRPPADAASTRQGYTPSSAFESGRVPTAAYRQCNNHAGLSANLL